MKIIDYAELTPELAAQGVAVLNMPNEEYHAYAGISKSGLDLIDRSPAHYAYRGSYETSRAMVLGSAIHAAILEPEHFHKQYMLLRDVTDRRASAYKQAAEQFGADNVLTGTEADQVIGMQAAIQGDVNATSMLSLHGWCEISLFATDPETGVLVKCRFDKLTQCGLGIDLKSTRDSRYSEFQRSIANYRYHVQDAWYRYVYKLVAGADLRDYKFLAVESELPHCCKIYTLDTESQLTGHKQAMRNLSTYAECLAANEWPAPDSADELMCLPAWALELDDEEVIEL